MIKDLESRLYWMAFEFFCDTFNCLLKMLIGLVILFVASSKRRLCHYFRRCPFWRGQIVMFNFNGNDKTLCYLFPLISNSFIILLVSNGIFKLAVGVLLFLHSVGHESITLRYKTGFVKCSLLRGVHSRNFSCPNPSPLRAEICSIVILHP